MNACQLSHLCSSERGSLPSSLWARLVSHSLHSTTTLARGTTPAGEETSAFEDQRAILFLLASRLRSRAPRARRLVLIRVTRPLARPRQRKIYSVFAPGSANRL